MTTRFDLAELAAMLQAPVDEVRAAVDALSSHGQLTAESFLFHDRSWRIAPSDVKRIQAWIASRGIDAAHNGRDRKRTPRLRSKRVLPQGQSGGGPVHPDGKPPPSDV